MFDEFSDRELKMICNVIWHYKSDKQKPSNIIYASEKEYTEYCRESKVLDGILKTIISSDRGKELFNI